MSRILFVAALLLTSTTAFVPTAQADHRIWIDSISSTSGGPGTTLDVYGYGFYQITGTHLVGEEAGCCYGVEWGIYHDGHLYFQLPSGLSDGNYTLEIYSEQWVCCDEYGYWYPDVEYASSPTFSYSFVDNDADGWSASADCNDSDASVYPSAWDTPYDGIDQDCSGVDSVIPDGLRAAFYARQAYYWSWGHDEAVVGIQANATHGFDAAYDTPEPPRPPATDFYLSASLVDESQVAPGNKLSTSVVPGSASVEWTLRMEWQNPNCYGYYYYCQYHIEWYLPSWDLPKEFNAYLVDGSNVYDIRGSGAINPNVCCESGTRDFRILITSDTIYSRTLPYGWSLVSLPVQTSDMSVASLFGGIVETAYRYDGWGYEPVSHLEPGMGYWVHNPHGYSTFSIVGAPVRNASLALHEGWNIIGAPFGGAPIEGSDLVANGFYWESNGYYQTTWLHEGHGTWVYATQPTTIQLGQMTTSTSARTNLPSLSDLLGASEDATATPFTLAMRVTDTGGAADGATLQTRRDASAGLDAKLDTPEAPRPAATTWTQAYFLSEGMAYDHAAVPTATKGVYELVVARDGDAGEQTLAWDSTFLPKELSFELVDGERRIDMRSVSSHTWFVAEGASSRTLQVVVKPADAPLCLVELNGLCAVAAPAVLGRLL